MYGFCKLLCFYQAGTHTCVLIKSPSLGLERAQDGRQLGTQAAIGMKAGMVKTWDMRAQGKRAGKNGTAKKVCGKGASITGCFEK